MSLKLIGVEKVMANLNKEIAKLKVKGMAGLIEAAIIIRRDMDITPPLIPVDWNNLRSSWYITTTTGSVAGDSPGFKGKEAGKMGSQHTSVVTAASNKAKSFPHPVVIMGFSAIYAAAIEEMKKKHPWKRPSSGPKFFESALNRNKALILTVIANSTRI